MRNLRALLCALALSSPLLAAPSSNAPPVVDALLSARVRWPLATLAERVPLRADEDFRVVEVGRDLQTSHHLLAVRTAEVPHRHDRHDLFVVVVRGHGNMLMGGTVEPVGEGSILYVPRGTPHAFRNASADPAIAYAVYFPAFDGTDRIAVEGPSSLEPTH